MYSSTSDLDDPVIRVVTGLSASRKSKRSHQMRGLVNASTFGEWLWDIA